MKKLKLLFLWHMHQPYYKDDISGVYEMPWVFLHAIKDYYDMPWLVEKHNIKATFNIVPSLIIQLNDYKDINVNDKLIKTIRKNVDLLNRDEKNFLLNNCFHSNLKTMIAPLPRFLELFEQKNRKDDFSNQDFLDLEILFLLSW
jgi:alpha-amylase/alpha-mannosidase (GH57 family)